MAPLKRKYNSITIEMKKKIIDASEADPKKPLTKLAEEFSTDEHILAKSTIHTILRDKHKILKAIDDGIDVKRSHLTPGRYTDLEEALLIWVQQIRSQNVAVTENLLKEKAIELAKELNVKNFRASSGWMDNFKKRHSIESHIKQEEADTSNEDEIVEIDEQLPITASVALRSFIILRRYFEQNGLDFIVVEKQGNNLCGTWNEDDLKPFVASESKVFEKPEFLTSEDMQGLQNVLDYKTKKFVINLQQDYNTKEHRKALHLFIRQHFDNQLVSSSTETGVEVSRYNSHKRKDARIEWPRDVGKFLHFTLKKTGHEVPYALNAVARAVGMSNSKCFNFAGSKDRRAVTYQRISVFKLLDSKLRDVRDKLAKLNIEVSEFSYENDQVKFGGHDGNVFYILLRNADIDGEKFEKVKTHGCLNIFGPQRFGSLSVNTADIGLLMLKNEYEAAVNILLDPDNVASQQMKDLLKRYAETKSTNILKEFPKYMESSNEGVLIKALCKNEEKKDKHLLALLQLPMRNRSLYLHAYQSKLFNEFAEIYKNKYGIDFCKDKEVPLPCSEVDGSFEEIHEIYSDLLRKDGLSFESFKSKETNFGIHLTKRDLVILPTDMSFRKITHKNPDEEIVFYPEPEEEKDFGEGYQSVLLKFTLPPGAYATTVLYELYGEHFKAGDGTNDFHEKDLKPENGTSERVEVE